MAEISPLTNAHAHARKASEEIEKINLDQAVVEHGHAASDFAQAARSTRDSEALRVLRLLEQEHLKLARIIQSHDGPGVNEPSSVEPAPTVSPTMKPETPPAENVTASKPRSTMSALAAARVGSQFRDTSPSLARDMASRRGIPAVGNNKPPSTAAQAHARQLSPEARRRDRTGHSAQIPPSVVHSQANLSPAKPIPRSENDDAFAKFYSNLTMGTMSKLSSVLAYAGLPLTSDFLPTEQGSKSKPDSRTVPASNEPDVKNFFSPAALHAIEDDHKKRGSQGHVFGPAESFYVVQTGGGTYSYADIAKAPSQLASGVDEEDEEAFVDAREEAPPSSPLRQSRFIKQPERTSRPGKSRTHEELELENDTLKQTLEQVAQRLSEFEAHAQDASMAALTQSMASLHNHAAPGVPDPTLLERLKRLEQQVQQQAEENTRLQSDMEKKDKTLRKYRSTWDEIKKSAKQKDQAKKEKAEKEAEDVSGPS